MRKVIVVEKSWRKEMIIAGWENEKNECNVFMWIVKGKDKVIVRCERKWEDMNVS